MPMEDINLHFTGDIHAIGAANNLLAAMIDNHIMHGNALDIDTKRITWRRCVDMNDRQLRYIRDGLGGEKDGVERDDGFDITVASEIMAILCLAESAADLKARLARIVIGYDTQNRPVTCSRLKAQGAMAALLKDAIKPNIVQTLEGTPAFVHGGPFANIAHGCNSVLATRMALKAADYAVTEAGFGADLGAEKFLDIKCRASGLRPAAVVVVATVRALKMHGGLDKSQLDAEDLAALERGIPNLLRHVRNIKTCIICRASLRSTASRRIPRQSLSSSRKSARSLTRTLYFPRCGRTAARAEKSLPRRSFASARRITPALASAMRMSLALKIRSAPLSGKFTAAEAPSFCRKQKTGRAPYCTGLRQTARVHSKTQSSFSDDAKKLGAPEDFTVTVRQIKVSAGAGFTVALAGNIMTMPGLPSVPAAEGIDIDDNGRITGLF